MVDELSLHLRKIVYFQKIEGMGHAELDTVWIPFTEVTLSDNPFLGIEGDAPKRADLQTDLASHAASLIYHHRIRSDIPLQGPARTNLQADWRLTLGAHEGHNPFLRRGGSNPDV